VAGHVLKAADSEPLCVQHSKLFLANQAHDDEEHRVCDEEDLLDWVIRTEVSVGLQLHLPFFCLHYGEKFQIVRPDNGKQGSSLWRACWCQPEAPGDARVLTLILATERPFHDVDEAWRW